MKQVLDDCYVQQWGVISEQLTDYTTHVLHPPSCVQCTPCTLFPLYAIEATVRCGQHLLLREHRKEIVCLVKNMEFE